MSQIQDPESGSNATSHLSQARLPSNSSQPNVTVSSASLDSLESALRDITSELKKLNLPAAKQHKEIETTGDGDVFYKNIGTVAALGASITFALIISNIADPRTVSRHGKFDLSAVRILLAVSWMLFMVVLSLSLSIGQSMILDSGEKKLSKAERKRRRRMNRVLSTGVYVLELAAVTCLSLVVAAYVEVVGYVMVALVFVVVAAIVLRLLGEKPGKPVELVASRTASWLNII